MTEFGRLIIKRLKRNVMNDKKHAGADHPKERKENNGTVPSEVLSKMHQIRILLVMLFYTQLSALALLGNAQCRESRSEGGVVGRFFTALTNISTIRYA